MNHMDMVRSHVETLIERLTGSDKAIGDDDGDYPIRYRNALYYVRVVARPEPVVQVFSVAVDAVEPTDALMHELNEINAKLHFARCFWVLGQVLFESEHLGISLDEADFRECASNVAAATDHYAPQIAKTHGGRLAFDDAKLPDYENPKLGMYL